MAGGGEGEKEGEGGGVVGGMRKGGVGGMRNSSFIIWIRSGACTNRSSSCSSSTCGTTMTTRSSSNSSKVKSTGISSRRRADITVGAFVVGVDATERQGHNNDGEAGREGAEEGEAGRRCASAAAVTAVVIKGALGFILLVHRVEKKKSAEVQARGEGRQAGSDTNGDRSPA